MARRHKGRGEATAGASLGSRFTLLVMVRSRLLADSLQAANSLGEDPQRLRLQRRRVAGGGLAGGTALRVRKRSLNPQMDSSMDARAGARHTTAVAIRFGSVRRSL